MAQAVATTVVRLYSCRWGWCPFSCEKDGQLREHVINQHIFNARPIRRGDLPDIIRAEEGIGESISIDGKIIDYSQTSQVNGPISKPESQPLQEPSSSLPSPPRSHRSSASPQTQTFTTLEPESSQSQLEFTFNSDIHSLSQPPFDSIFETPQSQRFLSFSPQGTPNLAALDSPSKPQQIPNPESPAFDNLVDAALNKRKRDGVDDVGPALQRRRLPTSASVESHASSSSLRSLQSVERQLTQINPEEEEVLNQYFHTDRLADPLNDLLSNPYGAKTFHAAEEPLLEAFQSTQDLPTSQPSPRDVVAHDSESSLQLPPSGQPRRGPSVFLDSSPPVSQYSFSSSHRNAYGQTSTSFPHSAEKSSKMADPKAQFVSGTLPPLNSRRRQNRTFISSRPGKQPAAIAPDLPLTKEKVCTLEPGEGEEEEENSQEATYPPLQTQAPYQSQT